MLRFTKKQLILLYVVSCIFIMILAFRFAISPLLYENSELRLLKTETEKKSGEINGYPTEIEISKINLAESEEKTDALASRLLPLLTSNEDIIDYVLSYTGKYSITPLSMQLGKTHNVLDISVVGVPLLYRTDIDITVKAPEKTCLALINAISNDSSMLLKEYNLSSIALEVPVGDGFTTEPGCQMSISFALYMFG